MKWFTFNALPALIFIFLSSPLSAQVSNYSSHELILRFADGTTPQEQQDFLDYYNLIVLDGPTPISEFLLCKIDPYFPNLPPGSYPNPLDSINGVIEEIKNSNPQIDGVGRNFEVTNPGVYVNKLTESGVPHPLYLCPQSTLSMDIDPAGQYGSQVGIFDTGISGESLGPNFYVDFPGLFEPHFDLTNPGINFLDPLEHPKDDNGHGTHVTSIMVAGAPGNPADLELRAYKSFNKFGLGNLFYLIYSLDEAALENTKIANLSLSYSAEAEQKYNLDAPLRIAIDEVTHYNGMLMIASAGNNHVNNDNNWGNVAFPASFPDDNIITVAAIDCSGYLTDFSNMGATTVDIGALGENVPGAYLHEDIIVMSGTSQAAAGVTRVAAMLAAHQNTFDAAKIKCALINSATPHFSLLNKVVSNGYMDAEAALIEMQQNCSGNGGLPFLDKARISNGDYALKINHSINDAGLQLEIISDKDQAANLIILNNLGQVLVQDQIQLSIGVNTHFHTLPIDDVLSFYFMQIEVGGERELIKIVR